MKKLLLLLVFLLGLRLLSLGLYDVYDATEARYAGIAFRMAESGDFVTPWVLPNVPFLAKPPLSFWATALSFKIFGSYDEFFARLPHFLAMVLVLFTGFVWIRKLAGKEKAVVFSIILASTVGFLILAGSVMTDAFLILGITFTNIGFFYGFKSKKYGYLFFFGLVISVLSKGLVGVILSGLPCFLFVLIRKKWKALRNFPMFTGFIGFACLTMPWFYLMEKANSGFLEYFLLGEHFKRFLISGWEGDRYGYAHNEPPLTIFLFFIICTLQWSIYAMILLYRNRKRLTFKVNEGELFLWLTFLVPLVFFSFSRNIIIPYAGVSLLPFAALLAMYSNPTQKMIIWLSLPLSIIMFFGFIIGTKIFSENDKSLIASFNREGTGKLYYLKEPDFNSFFYSRDTLVKIGAEDLLNIPHAFFITSEERNERKVSCNRRRCLYEKI